MFDRWLLRATMWARNPPSLRMVIFVFALLLFGIAVGVYEHFFGWPEFLTVNGRARRGGL